MNLGEYRILFFTIVAILALLAASPALSRLLVYPRTEYFTELWILGPNHRAENYPFNITSNQDSRIFLGIANHLGYCAYYLVQVKFRNQTQSAPTSFGPVSSRTPSSLPSLYNITAFVSDESVWELPLKFSFDYRYDSSISRVEFGDLILNGVLLDIRNCTITWDSYKNEFRSDLFFELWIYNKTSSNFSFHGRFVDLHLNMTV